MELAKEAVALDPTEADHKAALGKAFSALKLRKLATAEFEKAVALTPRKRTTLLALSWRCVCPMSQHEA